MSTTLVAVGPALLVGVVALAGAATALAAAARLGTARATTVAAARAVLQLAVVSFVLLAVLESAALTGAFLLLMFVVASATAADRMGARAAGGWRAVPLVAVPLAAGTLPVTAGLLLSGLLPASPLAVVPVTGILIGGAMTATGLSGRRAADELRTRHGEVEAAMALGLTVRDARLEVCRTAAAQGLVPALDQTRTVGLVTLPGAFVGVLVAGGSPLEAGAVQLLLLVGLLAVQTVSVAVTTELVARGALRLRR